MQAEGLDCLSSCRRSETAVCGVWRKGLDRLSCVSLKELSQLQEPDLLRPQQESEVAGPQQTFLSLSALPLHRARPSGTAVSSARAVGTLLCQRSACQPQCLHVVLSPPRGFTDPKGSEAILDHKNRKH